MKINIVGGSGPLGETYKPIFERAGHEVIISGRTSPITPEEAASQSDLTIFNVPISVTESMIKRVAPYCSAMMDFTGIKGFPIQAMTSYSKSGVEVAGLHPLHAKTDSIKGKTVVFCPTYRTGIKCREIVDIIRGEGANIVVSKPDEHDKMMHLTQSKRILFLKQFVFDLILSGKTLQEVLTFAPPPMRIMLDMVARQFQERNDILYEEMLKFNPITQKDLMGYAMQSPCSPDYFNLPPERVRQYLGADFMEKAIARSQKYVDII
jgi:prephenate dehydrogenase